MKNEFFNFTIILTILTFLIHSDALMSHPVEHFINLKTSGAYGLGMLHPLIFAFIVYALIWIPRRIVKLFRYKKRG